MANISIGDKVYNNVHSVGLKNDSGGTEIFSKYIVGAPIEFNLSIDNWVGTTYSIKIEGYNVGAYGVQVGMPSVTDVNVAQEIIECALTVPTWSHTVATSTAAAYTTVKLSAIRTPSMDIPVLLFGLEAI